MKTVKLVIVSIVISVFFIAGNVLINRVFAADEQVKKDSRIKYEYTTMRGNLFSNHVKGENGGISYSEDMRRLLDDGWRIVIYEPVDRFYLLERQK